MFDDWIGFQSEMFVGIVVMGSTLLILIWMKCALVKEKNNEEYSLLKNGNESGEGST